MIFYHRRALIINEGSHCIPQISWMNEVFLIEGSCPAAGAVCFWRCSGAGTHLQESWKKKKKLQCEEKQSEQNQGGRFFFQIVFFMTANEARLGFFLGGGAQTFLHSFIWTHFSWSGSRCTTGGLSPAIFNVCNLAYFILLYWICFYFLLKSCCSTSVQ